MSELLIFAGTSEGRRLSEFLIQQGKPHLVCVATEYGEDCLEEHPLRKVYCGRMKEAEMEVFLQEHPVQIIIDATHPYATEVTENIKTAAKAKGVPYLRLKREEDMDEDGKHMHYFASSEACKESLKETEGNILLTTGSKELNIFCEGGDLQERLIVRVLPGRESIDICEKNGLHGRQIVAMQGPFSKEMNLALLHQFQIRHMVTKQSGRAGGYEEKLQAAKEAGVDLYVIGRPAEEHGYSLEEVCAMFSKETEEKKLVLTLAGIGMGKKEGMTLEVFRAIQEADVLLGAERMIRDWTPKVEKKPYYLASQILPYLEELQNRQCSQKGLNVGILFSGDSGFYSGSNALYEKLENAIAEGRLQASLKVLPGISSVSYLTSLLGEAYQDGEILSIHGKGLPNLIHRIRQQEKVFLLLSGVQDVNWLGALLMEGNLSHCEVVVGYQLSYEDQEIQYCTPKECMELKKEGLYLCLIKNPKATRQRIAPGCKDEQFLRAKVPMTKEEMRQVSICKLHLTQDSICLDIGSGTGSIAVEMALLSPDLQVFALEQKEEAVHLIRENLQKFQLDNVQVIHAKAPEGLDSLPTPSHAFIGGSGGNLKEILEALYDRNPSMRVVLNAISLETIGELKAIEEAFPCHEFEIVQMQVSRTRKVGRYHLQQAENPIWICSFTFGEGETV